MKTGGIYKIFWGYNFKTGRIKYTYDLIPATSEDTTENSDSKKSSEDTTVKTGCIIYSYDYFYSPLKILLKIVID